MLRRQKTKEVFMFSVGEPISATGRGENPSNIVVPEADVEGASTGSESERIFNVGVAFTGGLDMRDFSSGATDLWVGVNVNPVNHIRLHLGGFVGFDARPRQANYEIIQTEDGGRGGISGRNRHLEYVVRGGSNGPSFLTTNEMMAYTVSLGIEGGVSAWLTEGLGLIASIGGGARLNGEGDNGVNLYVRLLLAAGSELAQVLIGYTQHLEFWSNERVPSELTVGLSFFLW